LSYFANTSEKEIKALTQYEKIKSVNFTFRNADVLNLLSKRAAQLRQANFEGAEKIEK